MSAAVRLVSTVVLVTLAWCAAGPAQASWPFAGGDAGRSGLLGAPIGSGALLLAYTHREQDLRTGPVITGGDATSKRVAYATADGRLHLRRLDTGAPVGDPAGTLLLPNGGVDSNAFFPRQTPIASTGGGAPGQLYVLVNDDRPAGLPAPLTGRQSGVVLAQVDEASGELVRSVPLAALGGFTTLSSPVLTPPDASGGRHLVFLANEGGDPAADLFSVRLERAATRDAQIGEVRTTAGREEELSPRSSPAVLRRPSGELAVAVGALATGGGSLKLFDPTSLARLAQSPRLGDEVTTVSIPLAQDGTSPTPATALLAAAGVTVAGGVGTPSRQEFRVVHLSPTLAVRASSVALPGRPPDGLAVTARATPAG